MGFTKPSITHAITTLQVGGFVERDEGGFIRLLYDKNVVVKTTGGLKLSQPSVNLALIASLVSSVTKKGIPSDTALIGDVGLTGELKRVPSLEIRLREISSPTH